MATRAWSSTVGASHSCPAKNDQASEDECDPEGHYDLITQFDMVVAKSNRDASCGARQQPGADPMRLVRCNNHFPRASRTTHFLTEWIVPLLAMMGQGGRGTAAGKHEARTAFRRSNFGVGPRVTFRTAKREHREQNEMAAAELHGDKCGPKM
jgi:hypothetical protein